jgi:hypothetical protein
MRIVAPLAGYTNLRVGRTVVLVSDRAGFRLRHIPCAAVLVRASRKRGNSAIRAAPSLSPTKPSFSPTRTTTWRDAQISRATVLTFLGRLDEAEEAAAAAVETLGDAPTAPASSGQRRCC